MIMSRLSHVLVTFHKRSDHLCHLVEPRQDHLVAINKALVVISDPCLFAELNDKTLCLAEVMPGQSREEMVDSLELEATVKKIEPLGAVHIQGGAELALGEGLGWAQVGSGHSPVGEGDLDMQQDRDRMGQQNEGHTGWPVRQGAPDERITKQSPVARHEDDLEPSRPPCGSKLRSARRKKVEPGEDVEVEPGNSHNGVVSVFLVGHKDIGGLIPHEGEVVEGAVDGLEVGGRVGEQWDVL